MTSHFETQHLILRTWQEADLPHLARMNGDGKVMEYFLKPLSMQETIDMYQQMQDSFHKYGFGPFAVEEKNSGAFVGFVGFHQVTFAADFAPAVEILWRLLPEFWGKGYATEAASACLTYAKEVLQLSEVVSFTSVSNKRSEKVMQKIGMTRTQEFNHPKVDPSHPLYRHVLYTFSCLPTSKNR